MRIRRVIKMLTCVRESAVVFVLSSVPIVRHWKVLMLIVSSRQEQEEDTSGRLDIVFCVSRVLYNRSTWLALCSRDHQSIIVSKLLWEAVKGTLEEPRVMVEMLLRFCWFSLGWCTMAEGRRSVHLCEVGGEAPKSVVCDVSDEVLWRNWGKWLIRLSESSTPRRNYTVGNLLINTNS